MKKLFLILLMPLFLAVSALADEGMWLPSLIHKINMDKMQQMGCKLTADDIYSINHSSLKDAVVALDRGSCTAELVSKDGLLLTNHHCGYGEIQEHSTVEHDYLNDGFWAKTRSEELPNPGKTVSFLIRVEDVTSRVMEGVKENMSIEERAEAINKASEEIEKEAKGDTHYEARVQSLYDNNQYFLFVYETFRDVRLVGTPPQSIGKFGGDTDNWMWPRHTGDFSIFRIYTGPDGKPAEYSEKNIPLQSKYYLPISIKGVNEDDFAMVMGYPGNTNRYKTSVGIKYTMEVTNPIRIEVRSKKLEIIKKYMDSGTLARIQYSSKYARSSNYYKYSIGQNKGLDNLDVIAKKAEIETDFTKWVNADESRKARYGKALEMISSGYADMALNKAREYMAEALVRGPEIYIFANRAQMLERLLQDKKGNEDRSAMVISRMKEGLDLFYKDYDARTDQKVAGALMKIYSDNVDEMYFPDFFNTVRSKYKGDFDKYTEKAFSQSFFTSKEKMEAFLNKPSLKTLKNDPIYQEAVSIFRKFGEISEKSEITLPEMEEGNRLFVAGLMEMNHDKVFYPDANSTMRLTYGQVMDYQPRDGVYYNYFTTLKGYIEKEIPGDDEFDVPAKLKEMYFANDFGPYADKDGTLHTCFITNNDITGGNSGSPVINGKGELIGIAFDGNWEAMSGDLAFEPGLQRCINVDIRFVLWVIDKYAGANNLIDEMKIVR